MTTTARRIDLHVHSYLSVDGELLPSEILRRAEVKGHRAVAITDHVDASNLEPVLERLLYFVEHEARHFVVQLVPGVELTDVPGAEIPRLARRARQLGARVVVVHGETLAEDVQPGTNHAAVECPDVDILAHPGLLKPEDAKVAGQTGVLLEITSRPAHALTNGHVARLALQTGAELVVNTDTHGPDDLMDEARARVVALGAGLSPEQAEAAIRVSPQRLLERRGARLLG